MSLQAPSTDEAAPAGGPSTQQIPTALRSRSFGSDRLAWAVFLGSLIIAFVAMQYWLHRKIPLYDVAAPPRTTYDFRLPVLVWDRVAKGRSDRHTPSEVVEAQLSALKAAGYQPVSLRQVRDAYRAGAPLPEHPILLTFDGGHLTTYRTVDPILRKLHWPAAMFLDTSAQESRHPTYVFWDSVQRMSDSGLWQFGVLGSWPESAWIVESNVKRVEVLAVAARTVTAFGDPEIATPPLAFGNTIFGVNDPTTNPSRLFRLHVDRHWSARDLMTRLNAVLDPPAVGAAGEVAAISPDRWVTAGGRSETVNGVMTLTGEPRGEAWLSGAEWARDYTLEAEVRFEGGPFWITQQGVESSQQWRWGGSERTLYLEQLRPGHHVEIISRVETTPRPGAWHKIRLVKRGGGVWIEWDGEPLAGMPHRIPEEVRSNLALSTGSLGDAGRVSIRNARFAELPYRVQPVSTTPSREEVEALLRDRATVAALSPPGYVQRGSGFERVTVDRELLAMISARGAWDVCPTIQLAPDEPRGADVARAVELAEVAVREGWSGFRIVGRDLTAPVRGAWHAAAKSWENAFTRRGLRLLVEISDT
jgi:hypothetical protein